ncbi:unnamed protein product [Boreogadus saida]
MKLLSDQTPQKGRAVSRRGPTTGLCVTEADTRGQSENDHSVANSPACPLALRPRRRPRLAGAVHRRGPTALEWTHQNPLGAAGGWCLQELLWAPISLVALWVPSAWSLVALWVSLVALWVPSAWWLSGSRQYGAWWLWSQGER